MHSASRYIHIFRVLSQSVLGFQYTCFGLKLSPNQGFEGSARHLGPLEQSVYSKWKVKKLFEDQEEQDVCVRTGSAEHPDIHGIVRTLHAVSIQSALSTLRGRAMSDIVCRSVLTPYYRLTNDAHRRDKMGITTRLKITWIHSDHVFFIPYSMGATSFTKKCYIPGWITSIVLVKGSLLLASQGVCSSHQHESDSDFLLCDGCAALGHNTTRDAPASECQGNLA